VEGWWRGGGLVEGCRVGVGVKGWCRVGVGFVSTLHPYVLPLFVGRFENILINYETKV